MPDPAGSPGHPVGRPLPLNALKPVGICVISGHGAQRGGARLGAGPDLRRAQARRIQQGSGRQGQGRLAREPRGLRERARARDPDHRARVRRLRHRGRQVPRAATARGPVHRLPPQAGRLRPAPAGRADDPGEAAVRRRSRRSRWRPSPTWSSSTRRSTRATSRRARTSSSTTSRCPTPRRRSARSATPGSPRARPAATPSATSPATRGRASARTSSFDPTPYVGAFVRYFVRNEVCQLLPRKFKVAFTATDEDVAITGIHDLGFVPRAASTACAGFEIRTGGGTSIMPRVAPTLYEFVELDDGEYLKVSEAVLRIFDRQEELRDEPRPRPDQVPDRQGRHRRVPRDGRRGARGRLGRRARLRRSSPCC